VPDRDIAGLFMALIAAGHEAMTGLIGNGLHGILNDSRCRNWILGHPDFPEAAVDELLRYDGPILSIMRRAKCDVIVAGQFVPEGAFIFNVLNAGNRDPREFSDPERLDFDRPVPAHVGLGVGMHQCVGAPMTKVVVRQAIPRFGQRPPACESGYGSPVNNSGRS
jgi:cytochrome P450